MVEVVVVVVVVVEALYVGLVGGDLAMTVVSRQGCAPAAPGGGPTLLSGRQPARKSRLVRVCECGPGPVSEWAQASYLPAFHLHLRLLLLHQLK